MKKNHIENHDVLNIIKQKKNTKIKISMIKNMIKIKKRENITNHIIDMIDQKVRIHILLILQYHEVYQDHTQKHQVKIDHIIMIIDQKVEINTIIKTIDLKVEINIIIILNLILRIIMIKKIINLQVKKIIKKTLETNIDLQVKKEQVHVILVDKKDIGQENVHKINRLIL